MNRLKIIGTAITVGAFVVPIIVCNLFPKSDDILTPMVNLGVVAFIVGIVVFSAGRFYDKA